MIEGRLKRAGFRALERAGVIAVSEVLARGIAILAYHGITEAPESPLSNVRRLHVWKGMFEEHLRFLGSRWRPVPLSTVSEAMDTGRRLPPRTVAVTIDDGYRNVLTVALPLLKRFGVPATVFVLTGVGRERRMWIDRLEAVIEATSVPFLHWEGRTFPLRSVTTKAEAIRALTRIFRELGIRREAALEELRTLLGKPSEPPNPDRDLLTPAEVRALRDAGLEIGSHAEDHEPLTARPLEEMRSALAKSRRVLETDLGDGRYALSYPYGAWNAQLARVVQEAGFCCAVTTDPGLNRPGGDRFGLKRLLVGADDNLPRLRASISGLRHVLRPIGAVSRSYDA
jgi:peptidoglycan/xylan/chitin deacetylase (PgdA/CDA1 family)